MPTPKFSKENGFTTSTERSELMRKIRSRNTKPEIRLRKALWRSGIRYRLNVKKVYGSPDILISKYRIAIFVDGELWHGFNWNVKRDSIKSNRDYWIPKIERNMERDTKLIANWHLMVIKCFGSGAMKSIKMWESVLPVLSDTLQSNL